MIHEYWYKSRLQTIYCILICLVYHLSTHMFGLKNSSTLHPSTKSCMTCIYTYTTVICIRLPAWFYGDTTVSQMSSHLFYVLFMGYLNINMALLGYTVLVVLLALGRCMYVLLCGCSAAHLLMACIVIHIL